MIGKRFAAANLPEALAKVKAEFGPDALILHNRRIRVGGLWGVFGRQMVEVTAAPAGTGGASPKRAQQGNRSVRAERIQPVAAARDRAERGQPLAAARDRGADPAYAALLTALREGGVAEQAAHALLIRVRERARDRGMPPERLHPLAAELIAEEIGEPGSPERSHRVHVFVGPHGAGKSSTLVKVASRFAAKGRRRVALVTADTLRPGAVEELRGYSRLLDLPLTVCYEPGELKQAMERHRDCDLVLVDTAGRNPRSGSAMAELGRQLDASRPAHVYLVLNLTTAYRDAQYAVQQHQVWGFDRYLLTRWDEVQAPGLIYSLVQHCRRPLSYVGTGNRVPDDLEVADPGKIARAILAGGEGGRGVGHAWA